MIRTSRQLKDLIRNMSHQKNTEPLILMRNFMMERFLERLSLSKYKDHLILKGGMLITAMVGINTRSTMDIDTTIRGIQLNTDSINHIVNEIISIRINDGVTFHLISSFEIMNESEYAGLRVSIETHFDGVRTPLKIDFSTGDMITPGEIVFEIPLMFEDRKIPVLAYPIETILSEKLETIISRSTTNTRMRDFYDIFILMKIYGELLQHENFTKAFEATTEKRGSTAIVQSASSIIDDIEHESSMQALWKGYQQKFQYASIVTWSDVIESVRVLIGTVPL